MSAPHEENGKTLDAGELLLEILDKDADIEKLRAALGSALAVAEEARLEWDAAPEGMKAGKLLIALAGGCPGYRADIDAIHAAWASPHKPDDLGDEFEGMTADLRQPSSL